MPFRPAWKSPPKQGDLEGLSFPWFVIVFVQPSAVFFASERKVGNKVNAVECGLQLSVGTILGSGGQNFAFYSIFNR